MDWCYMNEGQLKLFELLKMFDERCRRNGITYYLAGGAALGALRHKGFIPWDDDIDLFITRSEYQKLLACKDDIFDDEFMLVSHDEFPTYGNTLVRLVDTTSTLITKARIVDGTPKGYFLEFFILDPLPTDEAEREVWFGKHWVYTELMATAYLAANKKVDPWVDEALWAKYQARVNEVGREAVLKELEADLFSISEDDAVEYCARWGMRHLIYNIDWFGEPRFLDFEGFPVPVPSKVEDVLRFDYGDSWRFLPDVESDSFWVHTFAQNETVGYEAVLDDCECFINKDEVLAAYAPRKDALLANWFVRSRNHSQRLAIKERALKAVLDRTLPSAQEQRSLYEAGDMAKLRSCYEAWENQQFSADFWGWQKVIDLGDERLLCAYAPQLAKGSYSRVLLLLNHVQEQRSLSSELQDMKQFASCIRECYIELVERKNLAQAKTWFEGAKNCQLPHKESCFDFRYLAIRIALADSPKREDYETQKVAADGLLADFPGNLEVMVAAADCELGLGHCDEAKRLYEASAETKDGLLRMHVAGKLYELVEGE